VLVTLLSGVRLLVVVALVYAALVALTHWALRTRRLSPFGPLARLGRRLSEPVLLPLERRIVRAGGSPQDAPLWLLGIVIAGGLVLLTFVHWAVGFGASLGALAGAGPRAWVYLAVSATFSLLMAAIVVRVVASWFGISVYRRWMRPVAALTDWIIEPIRRVLPPVGMIDFSPMVAWLVLWVVRNFLLGVI
jgi:YggT family protein